MDMQLEMGQQEQTQSPLSNPSKSSPSRRSSIFLRGKRVSTITGLARIKFANDIQLYPIQI